MLEIVLRRTILGRLALHIVPAGGANASHQEFAFVWGEGGKCVLDESSSKEKIETIKISALADCDRMLFSADWAMAGKGGSLSAIFVERESYVTEVYHFIVSFSC